MKSVENLNANLMEQIAKAVTLFYAFLVFCGSLYSFFYYYTFHVDIFKYLSLSEILVSFLHILVPTTLIIIFLSGYIFAIKILTQLRLKKRSEGQNKSWLEKVFPNLPKLEIEKVQSVWIIIALITCSAFLFISQQRLSVTMKFSDYREDFWSFFVGISMLLIIVKYNAKFVVIITAIIFVMASVYNAVSEVKETLERAETNSFTFILELRNMFFCSILRIIPIPICQQIQ